MLHGDGGAFQRADSIIVLSSTQEARLKELLKRVTNLYEELGTDSSNQLRRINFSTFCNPKAKHDSFPDLTGVKARIVRYLIPVMLELCQTFVDETLYKKHRLQCITCLETMYQCMENQHLHPTEKAYKDFKENMEKCLLHYSRLAKISIQQHRLQWNTVHKHHLACHMPDQFRYLNCRFVSTYSGWGDHGWLHGFSWAQLSEWHSSPFGSYKGCLEVSIGDASEAEPQL